MLKPTIIFAAIVLAVALVIVLQGLRKKTIRVLEIVPSYKNAEIIGDGAVQNWSTTQAKYPPRSALISKMPEPRGM